jgi:hypothetical protein
MEFARNLLQDSFLGKGKKKGGSGKGKMSIQL